MKNRKLYQLFIGSVVSAAMMTSGVSVGAADFSDDAAVAAEQSVTSEEDAAPVVDAGSDFSADTAEATSDVAIDSTNFPDEQFRRIILILIMMESFLHLRSVRQKPSMCQDLVFQN